MIIKTYINVLPFLFSILFFSLFYHELLGINVLIFETLMIGTSFFLHKPEKEHVHAYIVLAGTFLSAVFVLLYGSTIAKAVNIFSFFFFLGYRCDTGLRSPLYSLANAGLYMIRVPGIIFDRFMTNRDKTRRAFTRFWFYCRIIFVPLLVLLFFTWIYAQANARFYHIMYDLLDACIKAIERFFRNFNFSVVWLVLCGFLISAAYLFHSGQKWLRALDQSSADKLERRRKRTEGKSSFRTMDLKKEYQSMLFLLLTMNILIAVLNIIDIDWIWINFTWEGSDKGAELKQFVHNGTYLLILAIILSVSIAMYIFRNNINFYARNKWIKLLAYVWLIQNAVMVVSVAMRTYRYVEYFNLAHKRIGLLFFLVAMLILITTVIIKIRYRRSSYFLVRTSALGAYLVLFLLCTINWDLVIARYNFAHAKTALLHKDWMITLSDKTLPVIRENLYLLDDSIHVQSWHYGKYGTYREFLEDRERQFLQAYRKRGIFSWNYADSRAFQLLNEQSRPPGAVTSR